MKSTRQYLADLKAKYQISKNRELAKLIDVKEATVSRYMSGDRVIDNTTALKIAQLLEIDEAIVIAQANFERESGENKKRWNDYLVKLGGMTASILLPVIFILSPSQAEAATILKDKYKALYIMLSRRLLKAARNLARAVSRNCQMLPAHAGCLG